MGGLELLAVMVLAGTITYAVENSGRRAYASWQESREQAHRRSEERAGKRSQRAEQVKDRFNSARSTGPRDPLWWPYTAGYGLAGAAAAAGAGAVGLAQGARAGAKSGYRVGQEGARKGWNLRDTWAQWRWENPRKPIDLQQCERCGDWVSELHTTMDHGFVCDDCLPDDDRETPEPESEPESDERMRCSHCGNHVPPHQLNDDMWCPDCATVYVRAQRMDTEETPPEKEKPEMNALPTGTGVAVTGEGYTDTIQSLQTVAKEAQEAYQAVTDLGDALNANSLDAETLQQIADLTDQLENASTTAENLARHVEQRHNPLAEATAAAGGSQNVANTNWYDQY